MLRSAGSLDRRDLAALVGAAVCWGLGTVVSKAALAEFAPVTLLAVQLASSLIVLTVLMRWRGIPLTGDAPALLGRLGLLNPGAAYALGLLGLVSITVSVSVLIWALEPMMIMLLAAVVLRERITPSLVALSIAAVVGIALVVYDSASIGAEVVGIVLALAGVACCAAYTVITRRYIPEARETSQVVLSQQVYALALALVLVMIAAVAGGSPLPTTISGIALVSAVASGVLYYAAAYWLYLGALRRVPASIAAGSFYLIPIVGVTAGALVLGERLGLTQWIGAAVVLASVLGILLRSSDPVASVATSEARGVGASSGPV
ncbi:MAG TPA: DMT family transporter [Candidatus Limnocylindrales bacterium]|nr:DMT family transporter [Candidatus Limnocylindrales bacterium]